MTGKVRKGLIVASVHVAIVASLGAKLLVDRATRPRVWARAAPYDPDLPIRGRYVRIRIEGTLDPPGPIGRATPVAVAARDQKLIFIRSETSTGLTARPSGRDSTVAILEQPVAYFIPERVPDPSQRPAGEELWVEVTIPTRGAPRPLRLGVKSNGVVTPLQLR